MVLAVDEKTQIQALDRTQPMLPLEPHRPARQTVTYRRLGTTCLLAALSVHEGQIEGRCVDRHTHQEFLAFLKHLYRKYPRKHLHVIVDNFSAHKHQKVREWASKRRRLMLHFTPTHASWLNQVEIWFVSFPRMLFGVVFGIQKKTSSNKLCTTSKNIMRKGHIPSSGHILENLWLLKYNLIYGTLHLTISGATNFFPSHNLARFKLCTLLGYPAAPLPCIATDNDKGGRGLYPRGGYSLGTWGQRAWNRRRVRPGGIFDRVRGPGRERPGRPDHRRYW